MIKEIELYNNMSNNNYGNQYNGNIYIGNTVPRSNVVFLSQPQGTNFQGNGQNANMFGVPLIPIVNETQVSATQRIKQVETEVKREKEMSKGYDEKELLKLVRKCDLHPNKLSDKCRYASKTI